MAPRLYINRPDYPFPTAKGGRGAFSYADTRVFAPGADPTDFFTRDFQVNSDTGAVTWGLPYKPFLGPKFLDAAGMIEYSMAEHPIPGGGGGARAPGKRLYGSRAVGYSPNGLVLIRLMRIE
jgi:hypothetical protein